MITGEHAPTPPAVAPGKSRLRKVLENAASVLLGVLIIHWAIGGFGIKLLVLRHRLTKDIPAGSPASRVESVLRSNGIEYRWRAEQRAYRGIVRGRPGLAIRRDVLVRVEMNESGQVKSVDVREGFTGF